MRPARGVVRSALAAAVATALLPAAPVRAVDGDSFDFTLLSRRFHGIPRAVAVDGTYLYLALDTGLEVYSLADPAVPVQVGALYLPSEALDVAVAGRHAYVAAGEHGLVVVDVGDPANPVVAGRFPMAGARGVAVDGRYAYVAEASLPPAPVYGLQIVDVAVPSAPAAVPGGFVPLPNGATAVAFDRIGGTAFVGTGSELGNPSHGVWAINVSTPGAPVRGAFVATGRAVNGLAFDRTTVYAACGFPATGSLVLIDVGTMSASATVPLADSARDVAVGFPYAYVAASALGLLVLDVTDPRAPASAGRFDTPRDSVAVAESRQRVFLGERASIEQGGLASLDAMLPSLPRQTSFAGHAEALGVAVETRPDRAYLLRRDALHVFDFAAPGGLQDEHVWSVARADFVAVDVDGTVAAVADARRVHLLDVSDPAAIAPLAGSPALVTAGVALRVVLEGNRLYVVTTTGVELFDVAAPAVPLAVYASAGRPAGLAIKAGTGYLAAGTTLVELDLAMLLPTGRSLVLPGEPLYGVAVSQTFDLGVMTGLVRAAYVFDPAAMSPLGMLPPGSGGYDVRFAGDDHVVIAAARDGVLSVSLADPANPAVDGFLDTSGFATTLDTLGQTVFLAAAAAQHWLMTCENCAAAPCDPQFALDFNSVRGVKRPGDAVYTWRTTPAGQGTSNVHRTTAKSAIPALWGDATSIVCVAPATSCIDATAAAAGRPFFYQVYPADCTGTSVP